MEHYYSEKQTSPLRIKEIKVVLRGNTLQFYTGSGVFSIGKVDKGSEVLIENCIIKEGDNVLDLGCGYGAVGIAIAKAFPSAFVRMADINTRAVMLSKRNAKLNDVRNVEITQGNLYEGVDGKFNTILINPPQSAGRELCFEMIEKAKDYLKKEGLLQLVARHNKGGKELEKKMDIVFGNVKEIAKKGGYRIYVSELI